jgi:hypothetical protein
MAIYSSVPPPEQAEAVATFTVQNTLAALSLASSPSAKVRLSIPLEEPERRSDGVKARKEPLRRDSMNRREALLKGKEGSRRRLRWENGKLLFIFFYSLLRMCARSKRWRNSNKPTTKSGTCGR